MDLILNIKKNPKLDDRLNRKLLYYFLLESKEILTNKIKEKTPQDTGKLWRSWTPHLDYTGNLKRVKVSNSAKYAWYVEKGTGMFNEENPHMIEPKNASVLHAVIDGQDVFFRESKGQKGHHMAEKGFAEYKKQIPMIWERAFNRANAGG